MREALRLLVRSRINSYWIGWQLWKDRVLARQSPPANLAQVIIAPPCWNCSKPLSDVVLIDTLVSTYDLCKMTFQPGLLSLETNIASSIVVTGCPSAIGFQDCAIG